MSSTADARAGLRCSSQSPGNSARVTRYPRPPVCHPEFPPSGPRPSPGAAASHARSHHLRADRTGYRLPSLRKWCL